MSAPVQPTPPAKAAAKGQRRRQPPRRQHQPYRRASAVIDERPDGKPIIFGYGRHLSKKEKEHIQRRLLYAVVGVIAVVCVIVVAFTAFYNSEIYPNQTVASINGHGINRHDRDTLANYVSALASAQNQTLPEDATTYATQTLQKHVLTSTKAQQVLGITVSSAELNTALNQSISQAGGATAFDRLLSATSISKDDYTRLVIAPGVLQQDIGAHLTRNNPKTAEQWHYARIGVANQKAGQAILTKLIPSGTGTISTTVTFASLAKADSTDSASKSQGGDLGWVRTTDSSIDSLLPEFLPTLRSMEKSHTKYQLVHANTGWFVLEFLGHDLKHALSATQIQNDQVAAFNTEYSQWELAAIFVPPLPASQYSNGTGPVPTPAATAVPTSSGGPRATTTKNSGSGKKK